jgi:hypothetical protein
LMGGVAFCDRELVVIRNLKKQPWLLCILRTLSLFDQIIEETFPIIRIANLDASMCIAFIGIMDIEARTQRCLVRSNWS